MKKIFIICLILLTTSCSIIKDKKQDEKIEEINTDNYEEKYIDNNPIELGLYLYTGKYSNKEKLTNYYAPFTSGEDIGSFEVFFTSDNTVNGSSFKEIWNKYYNDYNNISNYKVGFNIKVILNDGSIIENNFLTPDIYKLSPYFYVYLYDDVNQEDNSFYSHLEEISDNNIITSIKLFAVDEIDKVEYITLKAFTYDEDDFDSNNNYRGNSSYEIEIKRK